MEMLSSFNYFDYLILPFCIFLARICDVSIGTMRIVMIWIIAIGRIMQNLDNWVCYIFYAAGFATGNYIGMLIEERLAVGISQIQIMTSQDSEGLIDSLCVAGYGITHHLAEGGASGNAVSIIYCIIKRTESEKVISLISKFNPEAFYAISDIRFVNKALPTAFGKGPFRWR
jgi:uncharacterized protein YebE (UPF0316 family)